MSPVCICNLGGFFGAGYLGASNLRSRYFCPLADVNTNGSSFPSYKTHITVSFWEHPDLLSPGIVSLFAWFGCTTGLTWSVTKGFFGKTGFLDVKGFCASNLARRFLTPSFSIVRPTQTTNCCETRNEHRLQGESFRIFSTVCLFTSHDFTINHVTFTSQYNHVTFNMAHNEFSEYSNFLTQELQVNCEKYKNEEGNSTSTTLCFCNKNKGTGQTKCQPCHFMSQ